MTHTNTKLSALALAVSTVLAGVAHAGHEIVSESKNQVIQQTGPALSGSVSAGYWSKYVFRGTNLTPGSDGLIWAQAYLSVQPWEHGTFTFGVWAGSQQGNAQVNGAERIGEAGGGGFAGGGSRLASDAGGAPITGKDKNGNDVTFDPSSAGTFDFFTGTFTPLPREQLDDLAEAFAKIDPNSNGVTGDEYIEFIRKEFSILGIKLPHSVFAAPDFLAGGPAPRQITRFKTTNEAVQDRFTEIDATVSYQHDFGPVQLEVGNIFFYIDRDSTSFSTVREFYASDAAREFIDSQSFATNFLTSGRRVTFAPAVPIRPGHPEDFLLNGGKTLKFRNRSTGDEMFDRVYADLTTNALIQYWGIKPHLTYYHTLVNDGDSGSLALATKRYDIKGGYAAFKVNASIPLWKVGSPAVNDYKTGKAVAGDEKVKLSLDPTAQIAYSFRDRADADGTPLEGFSHVQAGAQLTWNVTDTFRVIPEVNYMHHISDPTLGTEENEWWGGGRIEVSF